MGAADGRGMKCAGILGSGASRGSSVADEGIGARGDSTTGALRFGAASPAGHVRARFACCLARAFGARGPRHTV